MKNPPLYRRLSSLFILFFIASLLYRIHAQPVLAARVLSPQAGIVGNGTPGSCTETALDTALLGGGLITFNCGTTRHTITLSSTKIIANSVAVDGNGLITLSGALAVTIFRVQPGATLEVVNLTITEGQASGGSGGGIENHGALVVAHSHFTRNHADQFGGAILNYGTLQLSDSTFTDNRADTNGGAIDTVATLIIARSTFTNNHASFRGGGINNYLGEVTLSESVFTGNSSDGYGGGLVNDEGSVVIRASSFYSNTAQDVGGAIRNTGKLTLSDSTLAYNTARNLGGAIINSGPFDLINTTLSSNTAGSGGGGIENSAAGVASFINATLVGNVSRITAGGNLNNAGAFEIRNSIVVNGGLILNCQGPFTSLGNNIESGTDCGFTAPGDLQQQQPALTALQDNGGPTYTQAPLAGATAIDHFSPATCPSTDQRGLGRPQGTLCDVGAVEYLSQPPLVSTTYPMPWPMIGHESRHSGQGIAPGPDDAKVLGAPWPFVAQSRIGTSPAIDYAGTAYFGADDGKLYAVDRLGGLRFTFATGGPIVSSPALVPAGLGPVPGEEETYHPPLDASVYFGSDDGRVYALQSNGKLQWALALTPALTAVRSAPVATKIAGSALNRIYIGADNGKLYAIVETSATAASIAWEMTTGAPLTTSPALSPNADLVYVGGADGQLYCVDAVNGTQLPNTPVALGPGSLTTPIVDASGNVYVGTAQGVVYSYDKQCHPRPYWHRNLGAPISAAPALGPNGEVFVLAGNQLHALSPFGNPLWKTVPFARPVGAVAPIVDSVGTVYVASADGWLFAVNHKPGALNGTVKWTIQVDPAAAPYLGTPALDGFGRIYVGAAGNHLEVIDDQPAFQLLYHSDQAAPSNLDIYSLRESYGVPDPTRTLRLTEHKAHERTPAYALDRSLTAYTSNRTVDANGYLADSIGANAVSLTTARAGAPFGVNSLEGDPAFTAIDDLTGVSRLPDGKRYFAVTTGAAGLNRIVFVDLGRYARGATRVLSLTDWAAAQGVPASITALLELPHLAQSAIAFAPDGQKAAWRECNPVTNNGTIQLLVLAGAASRLIGSPFSYNPELRTPCQDSPSFAPDSRWLVTSNQNALTVLNASDGAVLFTTPAPVGSAPTHPSWSPDGSEIAVGLARGNTVDLSALSGVAYANAVPLTASHTSDEPYYHYFKMPPPQAKSLSPDRQFPGDTIQIYGRGFDILHPLDNQVFFTDTLHSTWLPAQVLGASVDPHAGLGVLTVRVPDLAGNGAIRVQTRFGLSTCCKFFILPKPATMVQPRSVVGAKVRVFGIGFDVKEATDYTVLFSKAGGGTVSAPVLSGAVDGAQEYLVVQVPAGVAESGAIRVENAQGRGDCPCTFALLHPTFTIQRTTGLPEYAQQGCADIDVMATGTDFPLDPFWGYGTTNATLLALNLVGAPLPVPITQPLLTFVAAGADTANIAPITFRFPLLIAARPLHPGGNLSILASDANLADANASAPFRIPLNNIPIIFVAGTSGVSLDTMTPLVYPFLGDPHGPVMHLPTLFAYAPGLQDPAGPRVWLGPEMIEYFIKDTLNFNRGNHYLDVLAFDSNGANTLIPNSLIAPGTVMRKVTLAPGGALTKDVYDPLYNQLSTNLGRPLESGANGLYSFIYDWRGDMSTQAADLSIFVNSVLARGDVTASRVVLITHSLGGPVARAYYLSSPANAAKVDQVISINGGFAGVPKPLKVLAMGDTWGLGAGTGPLTIGVAEWETEKLAQNWGTAYFQAPNDESWFDDDVSRGGAFNRRYIRDERLLAPPVGSGYTIHQSWVISTYNGTLARRADSFFQSLTPRLGDFQHGAGPVYHQRLFSLGISTVSGFRLFTAPFIDREPLFADGDGTVTYHGMLGKTLPGDDRTYILRNIEHLEMTQRSEVHGLISRFLDGTVCSQGQGGASGFLSHNSIAERLSVPKPLVSSATQAQEATPEQSLTADYWFLRMRGGATMRITDSQERYTGPAIDQPALFAMGIPGVNYNPGQSFSYVSIQQPGIYTFTLAGLTPSALDIYLTGFAGATQLNTVLFQGVPMTSTSQVQFVVNTQTTEAPPMKLDYDGNGNIQLLLPTATLDPLASTDTTPPQTAITIDKAGVVTISAQDNPGGAGVLRTVYILDAQQIIVYAGPFQLPLGVQKVTAFSLDRNGNQEYPGVTVEPGRQGGRFIYLPLVQR